MIGEAVRYPMQDDDWIRTVIIGTVLLITSFLIIPVFLVYGYLLRVLDRASRGIPDPPEFGDWENLLVDGVKTFAVVFLYQIVPLILVMLVAVLGFLTLGEGGAGAVGIILGVLVLGVYVLVALLLPAALTNMAREGSFGAAFDFDTILGGVLTGDYIIALILAIVVGGVLGAVAAVLTFLIVGIFLVFYVQVVTFYLIGSGYGRAVDPGVN